ncbi:xanthine dehydrogenase family protein molybdopterin-binding subunit [Wenxinia marina]|uniref:Aerobic-type carbon monoxide dehydrogenase, large subunit CoxL/CutL-like protein n=1 Tax=Wenxinia marina DSM 24838 TaxID=1123501 RepID=A0A0D0QCK9_9RHOB|nr:molybdopterin cofactor-binding domain-containing protein [Wenxinia marina]KIQ70062.1 Aerobic-type carbon monoxide dehydrogenase, large subunit CoxL/CutL-like protein [Wenxinia marina DSM 24838]GGL63211.1 aldehyde dehydrogenase [Wenxinia marina]
MTERFNLSRRGFLISAAASTGGLAIGFPLGASAQQLNELASPELNAWVVVQPDDTVIVRVAKIEMGQGTLTGLVQLVAEELDADWDKVTWSYPTPGENVARERVWGSFGTFGSQGIRTSQEMVRTGGAAAKAMLIQAAANRWGVDASEVTASKGVLTGPGGDTLTYGAVAEEAAGLEVPAEVTLKDPSEWTIAGQSLLRLDTADKTDGSRIFSIDYTMDGMLNAAIKIAPVQGATVAGIDAAAVEGMPGVQRVLQVDETTVAVVADTWWRARTAIEALPIEWNIPEDVGSFGMEDLEAMLTEGLTADDAFVGNEAGDVEAAFADAAQVVEADYSYPWQHHVTMEPMNATALVTDDSCTVWTSTQNAESDLAAASETSGLEIPQCEIHRMNLGGGFGRRGASSTDYTTIAVKIAMEMKGTPVKVIWSREEDMLHGTYHPATKARFRGALDEDGNLTGMHMRISGQSIFAGLMPFALEDGMDPLQFQGLQAESTEGAFGYDVPNLLIDHAMRNPPLRPGFWRGVNNNQNSFYLESFVDELAHAAGRDPLEFRRGMMANHPKHLAVLNAVAEGIGWEAGAPEGRAYGICQHMGYGSYVAAAAEVSVDGDRVTIHRIVAATDPGHVVNPQQVEAQIEGSFAMGLSASMMSQITMENGRVQEENFDTYPIISMWEMPEVEKILVPSGGFWGGVGEPTIFVATPAVLNAVFALTGTRVRELPIYKSGLSLG